ncbi:winged helix-turn-helix transcriptional regulator [Tsukamurella soli]|uniref:Helix-turn-helix domain-containing protein n=1 Tax=Tsukamurella soli TaxID=644556 RepID=A0ABP8J1F2_9ACTN
MKVSFARIKGDQPELFDEGCGTRVILDHVMSKWGVLVLASLSDGTLRWGELRREVTGISEKMLASTLRTLAGDGLVHRESFPAVPPHVEYSLTPLGRELMDRMLPLLAWIGDNADGMLGREQGSTAVRKAASAGK